MNEMEMRRCPGHERIGVWAHLLRIWLNKKPNKINRLYITTHKLYKAACTLFGKNVNKHDHGRPCNKVLHIPERRYLREVLQERREQRHIGSRLFVSIFSLVLFSVRPWSPQRELRARDIVAFYDCWCCIMLYRGAYVWGCKHLWMVLGRNSPSPYPTCVLISLHSGGRECAPNNDTKKHFIVSIIAQVRLLIEQEEWVSWNLLFLKISSHAIKWKQQNITTATTHHLKRSTKTWKTMGENDKPWKNIEQVCTIASHRRKLVNKKEAIERKK